MTGPSEPRPGRHSLPDAGGNAGRPVAEFLAAWANRGSTAVDVADEPADQPAGRRTDRPGTGDVAHPAPRPFATSAADGAGEPVAPRPAADDVRWARLQRSAGAAPQAAAPAPRTAEMPASTPRVPGSGDAAVLSSRPAAARSAAGRPAESRSAASHPAARPAPARPAGARPGASHPALSRTTATRSGSGTSFVVRSADLVDDDDRFADAATAPGSSTGASRPAVAARPAQARRRADRLAEAPAGPLAEALHAQARLGGTLADGALLDGAPYADARHDDLISDEPRRRSATLVAGGAVNRHHGADDDPGEHPDTAHRRADDPHPDRPYADGPRTEEYGYGDDHLPTVFDQTGGLEVIVAEDDDEEDDEHDDHGSDGTGGNGPGGGRGSGGGRGGSPGRRRRPVAAVVSLLVLAALVAGIVVGGQALLERVNPAAEDFTGSGSGEVDLRITSGESLRTIAKSLVAEDVIASTEPFLDAAEARPEATGIQPGVYRMRERMSGQAALDLLLDPATRQLSRVTVPEGLTVAQTLQRLADATGTPLADLQAAAADTAALGLPGYANGLLEGFLFPATYDFEPDTAPVDMLRPMVARAVQALDALQIPADQRLTVLTKASIVQAESSTPEDMAKVARVVENRLSDGMPLQMDSSVNYASGKSGITTTAEDRASPSPYNTYAHPGLPPGAINNPGEQALRAVLSPAQGEWRYFVVVDPDTGETRFAVTAAEHQQNVVLFQQWLRENPGG